MKKASFLLICLLLAIPCQARTITVDCNGPSDFNDIQAAINDANDGDTIVVAEGRYTGNGNRDIDFGGRAITVRSIDPNDWDIVSATIIDCNGTQAEPHRGFYFHSGEDANSVVSSLTITNGFGPYMPWGAGMDLPQGGGILCVGTCYPTISKCIITGNLADWGAGILCVSVNISNCIITNNSTVSGWPGGGIVFGYCSPTITNCTITGNSSYGIYQLGLGASMISNSIVWGNSFGEIDVWDLSIVTYSNVEGGWPGEGNIDASPCFADPNNGDYHLQSQAGRWDPNTNNWVIDANTSPCIDAGNPGCPLGDEPSDSNNVRINMGAYGGTAEASKSPANWRSIADLTNDWEVDFNDLKVFVDYWLETGQCIPSDLTRNQSVDFADFAIMALHWLEDNAP